MTSSVNPASSGQSVTFTATVPSGSGTPTGNVTFFDGVVVLASIPVDVSGHASFSTSTLTTGTHLVRALYSGSGSFLGSTSTSPPLSEVVNPAAPSTAVPVPALDFRGLALLVAALAGTGIFMAGRK